MKTAQEHEEAARQARERTGGGEQEKTPDEKLKEKYSFAKAKRVSDLNETLPGELVKGVIFIGRRFMLTGGSKARKSFLLQQEVFCIGNGFPFLGFVTTKVKVIYVNLELLEPICRQRFEAMMRAAAPDRPSLENIRIISVAEHLDQLDEDFIQFIVMQAKEFAAELVIIDPIWRLFSGDRDENLTKDIREVLKPLTIFCRELYASLGFAQHQTKGRQDQKEAIDKFAGGGGFARDAATMIVMSNHQTDNAAIIEIVTNDFEPIEKFVIRFAFPFFVVDGSLDPEAVREPRKPGGRPGTVNRDVEAIFGFLQEADYDGGLTRSELAEKLDIRFGEEISTDTIGRRVGELQKTGKVIENKHVKPFRYALSVEEAGKLATRRNKYGQSSNGEHEPEPAEEEGLARAKEPTTARVPITAKFLHDQMPDQRWFTMQEFIDWAKEGWETGEKKARNILNDLEGRKLVETISENRQGVRPLVRYRKMVADGTKHS
jgi:hypothetical protein